MGSSQWWLLANAPPPSFQNRPEELIFEIEESSTTRRSGKSTITREVYILFKDYSKLTVIAQYDKSSPESASFSQNRDPPPAIPERSKLQEFSHHFQPSILSPLERLAGTSVGDGTPYALVREIYSRIPDILPSAGSRTHGIRIYENMANVNTNSLDEIRPGDVVVFRHAKFGGSSNRKFGGTKYVTEAGRPEHTAIVYEWDGSKRKLKVFEQGREGRKVIQASYKLGDLKSGDIDIFRPVPRTWANW